jgi:hypothetical protein
MLTENCLDCVLRRCTSGCTCTPTLMEAHHEEHNSQTHLIKVEMSQAPACLVDITILPGTKSGGHKIKVGHAAAEWQPVQQHPPWCVRGSCQIAVGLAVSLNQLLSCNN